MKTKKSNLPEFKNEEQEAEYWDKHSPLECVVEPELQ
jgi:hypothetical protein